MIVQLWCVKKDSPMGAFERIIWLLCSLVLSKNQRFSDGFRGRAELNCFAWTRFVWFRCSGGVPLVLRWYSVDILGCSAGVPGNVQLFSHCSGVFRCSAGVPCSVLSCSGDPDFIVCLIKCCLLVELPPPTLLYIWWENIMKRETWHRY